MISSVDVLGELLRIYLWLRIGPGYFFSFLNRFWGEMGWGWQSSRRSLEDLEEGLTVAKVRKIDIGMHREELELL